MYEHVRWEKGEDKSVKINIVSKYKTVIENKKADAVNNNLKKDELLLSVVNSKSIYSSDNLFDSDVTKV